LTPNFKPKLQRAYRVPERTKSVIEGQIEDLLATGRIRPSCSEFSHPVILIAKPDKTFRMAIDYRFINEGTIADKFPMPRIDDLTRAIADSTYLTSLDATQGYYQVPMDPDSVKYTSFITHAGQYECVYLSFGLRNASATFSRVMEKILREHKKYAISFIDDICCHTKLEFDDHLEKLGRVFESVRQAGMTLKLKKCSFCKPTIRFLGFVVGQGLISPNPNKLLEISNLREPTTKKGIRSFLAMCRYYVSHIPHFSKIAVPLSDLTKNKVSASFTLTAEQRAAFEKIKECLLKAQELYVPDYSQSFNLSVDASDYAIGGCLSQMREGQEFPIEFISKKLSDSQRAWPIIMKESFAVLYCLEHFDNYCFHSHTHVYTDHNPLTYLASSASNNPKLLRWSLSLQRWDLSIHYRRGSDNVVADFLSRFT
jgi:hypothetical protein